MTTILLAFIASLLFVLLATPAVKRIALYYGLVDMPSDRKMHKRPVPRIGGVAIFISFFFPFALFFLFRQQSLVVESIFSDSRVFGFVIGAVLVFLIGLMDDIKSLPPGAKLVGQIIVALIAYYFGFQINIVTIPFTDGLILNFFALPVTVFWFVLVINAINLVDGLDGLAAGICLFVSLVMLFVCFTSNHLVVAMAFAALAGALIGFLRYNFNPASIFMGDSGSYFLGYTLAALSIAGSIKGQVATAMLIPVIALGVPLIDTLWAPIRRFVLGQKMFQPDREHFHHRLVRLGYTQRRAVLLIYAFTIILGISAILYVHSQNDTSALILFILGIGVIFTTRYLGIVDFFTMQRMVGWAQDLSDEAGISHDRRRFLNCQLKIAKASDLDSLWAAICQSLDTLEFDSADFNYTGWRPGEDAGQNKRHFSWRRSDSKVTASDQGCILKIELPLHDFDEEHFCNFGTLQLAKDMRHEIAGHYTLKRVEHLRRTMVSTLLKIAP